MFGIKISVDVDPHLATFLRHLGAVLVFTGLFLGVIHIFQPHPWLPAGSALGVVIGAGLALLFLEDDDDEPSTPDDPVVGIGVFGALVGIALFPVGAITTQPFRHAAIAGFLLLTLGAGLVLIREELQSEDSPGGEYRVPDDPMAILNEEDD